MIKEYKDDRINNIIKESFEKAIKDTEWNIRYLSEWNLLFDCIDKMLEFVESGKTKEIYINRNMWYILQDAMFNIFDLYGVDIVQEDKITEKELLIEKKDQKNMIEKDQKRLLVGILKLEETYKTLKTFNYSDCVLSEIYNIIEDLKGLVDNENIKDLIKEYEDTCKN